MRKGCLPASGSGGAFGGSHLSCHFSSIGAAPPERERGQSCGSAAGSEYKHLSHHLTRDLLQWLRGRSGKEGHLRTAAISRKVGVLHATTGKSEKMDLIRTPAHPGFFFNSAMDNTDLPTKYLFYFSSLGNLGRHVVLGSRPGLPKSDNILYKMCRYFCIPHPITTDSAKFGLLFKNWEFSCCT